MEENYILMINNKLTLRLIGRDDLVDFVNILQNINHICKNKCDKIIENEFVNIIYKYIDLHNDLILRYNKISTLIISLIFNLHNKNIINKICSLLEFNNLKFDENTTEFILLFLKKTNYIKHYHCFEITDRLINIMISRSSLYPVNDLTIILFNIARDTYNINIVHKVLDNAIDYVKMNQELIIKGNLSNNNIYEHYINSIKYLIPFPVDIQCLIKACKLKHEQLMLYIMDNKIVPDNDCFYSLFYFDNMMIIKKSVEIKTYIYNRYINLLIVYGYNLTYDDICYVSKHHIDICNEN